MKQAYFLKAVHQSTLQTIDYMFYLSIPIDLLVFLLGLMPGISYMYYQYVLIPIRFLQKDKGSW